MAVSVTSTYFGYLTCAEKDTVHHGGSHRLRVAFLRGWKYPPHFRPGCSSTMYRRSRSEVLSLSLKDRTTSPFSSARATGRQVLVDRSNRLSTNNQLTARRRSPVSAIMCSMVRSRRDSSNSPNMVSISAWVKWSRTWFEVPAAATVAGCSLSSSWFAVRQWGISFDRRWRRCAMTGCSRNTTPPRKWFNAMRHNRRW